ncbi:DUF1707 SHOCT-like domain-containing protein [Planosporangium mesophilum]|uniref:DUF1707 domain-containing protein n=1 Tax=Planosporangium mesophilum TaxID=689768 RepID=A0A8J3TAN0_9ACTN|nr:DUF1707 domain-containing protein [Planosporangium mesophilum]GII21776.1 hypothetical protein Pme01_13730 [Planosporangium mesophilum]
MSSEPRRVRASDAEREEYARIVRGAMGEGRLTLEEGEERLATVYAARYRDELPPFVADLPDSEPESPPGPEHKESRERRRAGSRITVAAAVTAVLVGLWALSGAHVFWPLIPLLIIWFGLLRRHWWRHCGDWPGPGPWAGRGPWPGPGPWAGRGPWPGPGPGEGPAGGVSGNQ